MNPERKEFLNLLSLPGRITSTEAAWRLGFEPDHIPILVSAGLLKRKRVIGYRGDDRGCHSEWQLWGKLRFGLR